MWAIITDDESGTILVKYQLRDSDIADCDTIARQHADNMGGSIDKGGYVPDGCSDFTVTLTDDPEQTVRVWNSRSYFFSAD